MLKQKTSYKKAFSLSENLTVLIVLGVIIAITVPNVVKDRTIKNDKIALRKAIVNYQAVLKKELMSSTGMKNTALFSARVNTNNCNNIRMAFNVSGHNGCEFTTADGIKWNLNDPQKTIVALKGGEISDDNAANDSNLKVFYITFDIDQDKRDIRILSPSDIVNVQKTIDFVTND